MSEFLFGESLSSKIRTVTSGQNVRCAVAYWGADCEQLIVDGADSARIVCDAVSGGTSPAALTSLGAPDNDRLRHLPNLHAKVYLSELGAVIGSANASHNGVGFDGQPSEQLVEAGVFCTAQSLAWRSASEWFDDIFQAARTVDDRILETAKERWRPARLPFPIGSLVELACADPDLFDGIGFVFSGSTNKPLAVDAARKSAGRSTRDTVRFSNWPSAQMFTEWETADLNQWPSKFFSFHKPASRLSISAKRLEYRDRQSGSVFALPIRLRDALNDAFPALAVAAKIDRDLVQRILDESDGSCIFPTARALAAFRRSQEI